MKLKKGDNVVVIAGSCKGQNGKITKVLEDKVIVEGINLRKKHLKPKNNNGTGEIVEIEAPIHVSNVMILDSKTGKRTRVGHDTDKNGKKIRISKKSNQKID